MHFTEEEIQALEKRFGDSLRQSAAELDPGRADLTEIQDWMIKNHVDRPEVLEQILRKMGTGEKGGKKKMS